MTKYYLPPNKYYFWFFSISANGKNHPLCTFPRNCPSCLPSNLLSNPTNSSVVSPDASWVARRRKEMWGPPGKWESLERISAALILMDGFQSYQEARGPGAQAEEESGLFTCTLLPLLSIQSTFFYHLVKIQSPRRVCPICHMQVSCPILPSHSYHAGEQRGPPVDSTVGDEEMGTASTKPHTLGDSLGRVIRSS